MTRWIQMLVHIECVPGPTEVKKRVTDLDAFRRLAVTCNAVVSSEWTLDDDASEAIREWFTRSDGVNRVVVQCMRAPTVKDWTEKNEKRKAVG